MSVEERLRGLEQYREELRNVMDVYPNAVRFKLPVELAGNKWTTFTPVVDTAYLDNGAGGRATVNYAKYTIIGKLMIVKIGLAGYKVGTNGIIVHIVADHAPFTLAKQDAHRKTVGNLTFYTTADNFGQVTFISADIWATVGAATIADNTAIDPALLMTFEL